MSSMHAVLLRYKELRRGMATPGAPQTLDEELGGFVGWDAFGLAPVAPAPSAAPPRLGPIPPPPPTPRGLSKPSPPPSILDHRIGNKAFILHIQSYLLDQNFSSFLELHHSIWECRQALKDERLVGKQLLPSQIECEKKFLKWLIVAVGNWARFRNPNVALVGELIPELIPFLPTLRTIMTFGCLDIERFPGNADPQFYVVASNRCWASELTVSQPHPYGITESRLAADLQRVMKNECAECLGFALAAAGCLLRGGFRGKLTLVTNGTHQFVIYDRGQLGMVIIDLWLGSVGKQWCWIEPDWPSYPFSMRNITPVLELDSRLMRVPAVPISKL